MHLVESSGNKPLSISRPISIPGAVTNQAGSLSMSPNDANAGGNDRKNAVVVDSTVKNKETKESNEDAKVGLKV